MGDYSRSINVAVPPAQLFSYLADVSHLPTYLPRLTSATPTHDDNVDVTAHIDPAGRARRDVPSETWMRVTVQGQTLQWGAPGPHGYHGVLDVDPGEGNDTSRLNVRLHIKHARATASTTGWTKSCTASPATSSKPCLTALHVSITLAASP